MIRDGRYTFEFGTLLGFGRACVELRNGEFSGVTEAGANLEGWCRYVPGRNVVAYQLIVHMPPNHTAVTGLTTGEYGRRVMVSGEKSLGLDGQRFSFGLAGRAVDVAMRYDGPLPEAVPVAKQEDALLCLT